VRTARERALARMPASDNAGGKRVYVTRKHMRFVANAEQIEQIAKVAGFATYDLEGMTPRAQMALFRDAEFVIGPHGAGLANLLFCAPGTKVIELSPDSEFRPYFAQISDKLDLSHAVLPCAVHGQGFNGRMTVDVDKFRMLLRQMLFRL
jgi:capsular polysaccharide biosynthesis protein